jgi:FMN phosphatase YigB (HAD superfamily)
MRRLIIADLDDTLIDSEEQIYREGQRRVLSFLQQTFDVSHEEFSVLQRELTHALHEKINPENGKPYHYSLERYTHGLRDCYRSLCKKHGVKEAKEMSRQVIRLAESVFSEDIIRACIKSETFDFMRFCRKNDIAVFVLTKGEENIQHMKLRILYQELEKRNSHAVYASEIATRDKTPEHFQKLMDVVKGKPMEIYVMGNSFEKDIRPALDAFPEVKGIFVPCQIWESNVEEELKTVCGKYSGRCVIAHNLIEVISVLKNETAIA